MTIRNFLTAVAVTAVSATALADLSGQYLDWGRGAAQYLMTSEEAATWKTIKSDDEAKAFIALFWARRDPTPDTPHNEYRADIEARIKYANEQFNREKVPGALTDRGRTLVLYGPPTRVDRVAPARNPNTDINSDLQRDAEAAQATQRWVYEDAKTKDVFGISKAELRFVDRDGEGDALTLEPSRVNLKKAHERAIKSALVQPNLTVAPTFASAAPAPVAAPAAPEAAVAMTELKTADLTSAIAAFKAAQKNPFDGKLYASWGEYVTADGVTYIPVGVFVPKSAAIASQNVTFFGVVQNEAGANVVAFEEPATLSTSKDEQYVHKTLEALPAGKYRGYFGLAENGKPIAISSTDMELAGSLDKSAAAVSNLILSNNLYPLPEAQRPTDPFAFGGIKVVPKGDRVFRTSDELWYFFELRNPGLPAPAADAPVPVDGQPAVALPKIQVKIDLEGTTDAEKKKVKMSAPPRETEAIPMRGVEGHFGVGNAIPLESFKPGEYTFTVKVIDTVKKATYTLSEKFRVIQ
jgi:GWxTD domain-containing protein